jgi:TRAP-type uncharacterized transport system substrate-binding protein
VATDWKFALPPILFVDITKEKAMKAFTPFHQTLSAAAIGLLIAGTAGAQQKEAQTDCDVRLGSGPKGGVYELLARDIQRLCGDAVSVCAVPSEGGLDNLTRLSTSEIDVGFAQVDTLQELIRGGDENMQKLQALMPLHANLLHVLSLTAGSKMGARTMMGTNIPMTGEVRVLRKFSDLKGVRVATVGSAQMLGQLLEKQVGYGMEFVLARNDDEAIELLRANKVQAIFTSGGWPMPNISRHQPAGGLSLVEYDLSPQAPYVTTKRTYKNLEAYNFSFLSAPNLLLTRPFKSTGAAGKRVAALQTCLVSHMDELQEGRYNGVWREIKNPMDTLGVTRFAGKADGTRTAARP